MPSSIVTPLHLDLPPRVYGIGVGLHGTPRLRERWLLPELHSLHLYSYDGELSVDGVPFTLRAGVASVVPPGSLMEFTFRGPSEHLYVHFALETVGEPAPVSLVQDLGFNASALFGRVSSASGLVNPAQRSAELWSVLWKLATLAERPPASRAGLHPAVEAAVTYVESHLAEPLTVPRVAETVQYSSSQLDRLFGAAVGCTVSAFVTRRRMALALHLLQDTSQSISLVACSVGIPDLHAFNKACHRWLGASPRVIRHGSPSHLDRKGQTPRDSVSLTHFREKAPPTPQQ